MAKKKLVGWGARIYEGRAAMRSKRGRKMSQEELGAAAGVSYQMIGFYESETYEPSWETWTKMAKALQMEPGELAFGSRKRESGRGKPNGGASEETA